MWKSFGWHQYAGPEPSRARAKGIAWWRMYLYVCGFHSRICPGGMIFCFFLHHQHRDVHVCQWSDLHCTCVSGRPHTEHASVTGRDVPQKGWGEGELSFFCRSFWNKFGVLLPEPPAWSHQVGVTSLFFSHCPTGLLHNISVCGQRAEPLQTKNNGWDTILNLTLFSPV